MKSYQNRNELIEDVDFVKGVLEAFRGFYGNAQAKN